MQGISSGLAIVIGVLVLFIIIMTAVVFVLACKKTGCCRGGGCTGRRDARCGASSSCPHNQPLPPGTTVTNDWVHKYIGDKYYVGANTTLCIEHDSHTGDNVCSGQFCPYGMTYSPDQGCVGNWGAPASDLLGSSLPPHKPLLTADDIRHNPSAYVEITSLGSPHRYVAKPRLALYHGGIVGAAKTEASGEIFANYMKTVGNFCAAKGIDVLFFSLDSPSKKQFPYFENPTYLAGLVDTLTNMTQGKTQMGVVAYVRPKDSGWHNAPTAPGGCIGDDNCHSQCDFVKPDGPCPLNCVSDPNAGQALCPSKGCPNVLAQTMIYVNSVNSHIKGPQKLTAFVFDGEDAGSYGSPCGFHIAQTASSTLTGGTVKDIGYAKALQAGVLCWPNSPGQDGVCPTGSTPTTSMVFPETYWFMNDLWPCTGSPSQLTGRPAVCTSQTSYRRFKDDPVGFMNYLHEADKCAYGTNGLVSLMNNIKPYKDRIWPMFSLERLSSVGNSKTPGGPVSCLALAYSGAQLDSEGHPLISDICGTFDGFGAWDWDAFLQFISLFAHVYGVDQVGIYESQFLPWSTEGEGNPSWISPISPLPPTPPKATCAESCLACQPNLGACSGPKDTSCATRLKAFPSCHKKSPKGGYYYADCEKDKEENYTCAIHIQSVKPGGNDCVDSAATWPPCTFGKSGNTQCQSYKTDPNYGGKICTPPQDYDAFCRSTGVCQVNYKPNGNV